ncbi:MAG: diacylglycerol kinase family lipid kinase [Candidatus Krumholzibacteria bacterium]|nr:diacylglycerol kinase family lipid kinase [Candidatus Krumholzibacteria bacterium]MDH4336129.1 diacylglycerol kinase family lipid kinase [Candidatus Krumholzibacteria bacterium]MDH5268770.1 diacylglycerol kinase family lipid kinase [Candidatus Krumholzibacteria bacterium]
MPRSGSFVVVVNPAAGRGRRRARLRDYLDRLRNQLGEFQPAVTERAGDEVAIVDRALADGASTIIALGGDGTWSAAADRIIASGRRDVALGLLPVGTGNDFGKSLGIRHEHADAVVRAIAERRTTTVDAGRAGGRHFLNVVGLGFDIAVIDDAERTPLLRGDLLYRFCALRQLFRFPGRNVTIESPGRPPEKLDILMLTVSNGNYFGGSFHIAPRASLADGRLDAVAIRDAGPFTRARLFSQVSRGAHEGLAEVVCLQSPSFTLRFDGTLRYEMDGEVYEARDSLTVESVPAALDICVPSREEAAS